MAPVRSGGGAGAGVQSKKYHHAVLCPICLDVFTEPVTTPCGHNYCKACITTYWDNDWVCQCPLCTKLFPTRPDVSVNTLISQMADQYRRSQQQEEQQQRHATTAAKPGDVSCDVCATAVRLKALKTCLVCLTSFCEAHLERHRSVAALRRHKLVEPVGSPEDALCRCGGHDDPRPLELFCRTDRAAVCRACAEQEHERHELVTLEEECEGRRAELRRTEGDVQRAIRERQGNIRLLHCSVEQAQAFMGELRAEVCELKKRGQRLKQLSCSENHLHLLQNFTTTIANAPPPPPSPPPPTPTANAMKGLPRAKVDDERFSCDVATVRTAVAQLEKTVRREIEKLRGAELRRNMELWS